MEVFFVYPGKRGSALECTLALHEIVKKLGIDSKLILSNDNDRATKVKKIYPDAEFYDFFSISDFLRLKKRLESGISFFTIVSPKILPIFLSLKSKKIFYFHATYDYSLSKKNINDHCMDFMHDSLIKSSTLTVATQWPLAWQIRNRLGVEAEVLSHPSYSSIRKRLFDEDTEVELPFKKFFLDFGAVDKFSKGTDVLLKAAKGTELNLVLAGGRISRNPHVENILNIDRWMKEGELHNLLKRSEAVILPYLTPSQFSGCLALAFHFRRPVLAPFSPTFEKWIDEDKTGWFFSLGDSDDLREKMYKIWGGKTKYSKIAIAAKEKEMEKKTMEDLKRILDQFL